MQPTCPAHHTRDNFYWLSHLPLNDWAHAFKSYQLKSRFNHCSNKRPALAFRSRVNIVSGHWDCCCRLSLAPSISLITSFYPVLTASLGADIVDTKLTCKWSVCPPVKIILIRIINNTQPVSHKQLLTPDWRRLFQILFWEIYVGTEMFLQLLNFQFKQGNLWFEA